MSRLCIQDHEGRERVVGDISEGVFYKKVKESVHLYRGLDAWGIDERLFKTVILANTHLMKILDTENNRLYEIEPKVFKEKGLYRNHKPFGAQIFLPRKYWRITEKKINKYG